MKMTIVMLIIAAITVLACCLAKQEEKDPLTVTLTHEEMVEFMEGATYLWPDRVTGDISALPDGMVKTVDGWVSGDISALSGIEAKSCMAWGYYPR